MAPKSVAAKPKMAPKSVAAKPKMAPLLPRTMWREILARLPVRSVVVCTAVCKSWRSLIFCPNFISHHSITNLHNNNGNRLLLQLSEVGTYQWSFVSHTEHCMKSYEEFDNLPELFVGREPRIVGSCNGLICLYGQEYDYVSHIIKFMVWNPATKTVLELPSPSSHSHSQSVSLVGFGFDSNTGDYKILCDVHTSPGKNNDCRIIALREGVWRSISPPVPSHEVRGASPECYANGAVYWRVFRYVKGAGRIILSFNMSDESFREIRMPDCAEFALNGDDDRVETYCVTFGGLVHVIAWKRNDNHDVDVSQSCSVWAMKEYGVAESWIKVSNIDLRRIRVLPGYRLFPNTFIIWSKHEILMVHHPPIDYDHRDSDYDADLVLYNTKSKKCKRIFSVPDNRVESMCQYKESLALLCNGSENPMYSTTRSISTHLEEDEAASTTGASKNGSRIDHGYESTDHGRLKKVRMVFK